MAREDIAVADSAVICAVCHRLQIRGDHNHVGDVFICAECRADATEFIGIQHSISGEADQAADATRNRNEQQHPDR